MVSCGVSNACTPPIVPRKAENVKTFLVLPKAVQRDQPPVDATEMQRDVAVDIQRNIRAEQSVQRWNEADEDHENAQVSKGSLLAGPGQFLKRLHDGITDQNGTNHEIPIPRLIHVDDHVIGLFGGFSFVHDAVGLGLFALVNQGLGWEGKFELRRVESAQDFQVDGARRQAHVGFLPDVIDGADVQ